MKKNFLHPPDYAKPGVYWYFMDGNMTAESITKDLESMKKAGIGNLIFLEVNVGIPRGPVDFLSDEWISLFAHAEKEARRLGIEITLGIGPGWTGSGGPWVKPQQSMQHLVSSQTIVTAGNKQKIMLPVPLPKKPFFGEGSLTDEIKAEWNRYYEDVAVLAFPVTEEIKQIIDYEEKALYYRAPYSSAVVKPYLPSPGIASIDKNNIINKSRIIDLTGKMEADGTLNWTPPSGKWVIMRFGSRNNGAITRPAPVPGLGFEVDKFDTTALNTHLDTYIGKLLNKIDKPQKNIPGGLKRLHMDSWEMSAQNWTGRFRQEFLRRRGYDPLKYYPVYAGNIVGSLQESERFLWDLRQTSQELVLENHARHVKAYGKRQNLLLSIEPYDMNPTADLELGSIADIPMGEFWSKGFGFNSTYSVIEATSIGHVGGKSQIAAEAFTSQNDEGWKQYPGAMKNQGDWAFAAGINQFVYHTFQNQFLPDSLKPGATMGPYGVHWDRSQTWWPMVSGYHDYVTRCQYLLQQGRTVADILYLTPEGSPHVFVPPASAIKGDTIGDRRGYNFDGCAPSQLMGAYVKNKQIIFPSGAAYRMLVLPVIETMTPKLLAKIGELVKQGATIVGSAPLRSPSLENYPLCDKNIKTLGRQIWGPMQNALTETRGKYGLGEVIWGSAYRENIDNLYPKYDVIANLLRAKNISEDFSTNQAIRYTHRTANGWDMYFVSNTTNQPVDFNGTFRTKIGSPELWNAINGKITRLDNFTVSNSNTSIPLHLDAYESAFIVFAETNKWTATNTSKLVTEQTIAEINGSWEVSFDIKWGGPENIKFDALIDWTKRSEEGIKYYSGTAVYKKSFDVPSTGITGGKRLYLHLGDVKNMARVKLNGTDLGVLWTAPWMVDISTAVLQENNQLEIEVVNLWPNRLIGDENRPDDGIKNGHWPEWLLKKQPRPSKRNTFSTHRFYNSKSPLFSSGLLGPVTIKQKL
ncbi:glycosyl hydrolase [Mucilaginibacter limnophilus]|nr:glycosyl hydrolase [Mucilaginibacter limnophilus]